MRLLHKPFSCATAALILSLVSGCSQAGAPPAPTKVLSPDESLECAALLFAVNNLMEIDDSDADAVAVKSGALAGLTRFGTDYANAKGLSSDEVLGLMKIKSYRMIGRVPGGEVLSEGVIVKRAKACLS